MLSWIFVRDDLQIFVGAKLLPQKCHTVTLQQAGVRRVLLGVVPSGRR